MRLVVELWDSRVLRGPANRHDTLLTSEFLPVMKNMVDVALDGWLKGEEWQDEWWCTIVINNVLMAHTWMMDKPDFKQLGNSSVAAHSMVN